MMLCKYCKREIDKMALNEDVYFWYHPHRGTTQCTANSLTTAAPDDQEN